MPEKTHTTTERLLWIVRATDINSGATTDLGAFFHESFAREAASAALSGSHYLSLHSILVKDEP